MNLTLKDIDELRLLVNKSTEIHVVRRKVKAWIAALNLRESPKQQVLMMSVGYGIKGHTFKKEFYIARKEGRSTHPYSLFHIKTGVKIADFANSFFEVTEAVAEISKVGNWDFDDVSTRKAGNALSKAGDILSGYKIKVKGKK